MATHKFLIVVDMQNDFIDGALGTREAVAIVAAAAERIRACREAGDTLIATLDTHDEDYMQTQEGHNLPVPHCIRCTAGWQLRPEIAEAPMCIHADCCAGVTPAKHEAALETLRSCQVAVV